MPTPSLLIVPARWKTGNPGKLYSQIPTNGDGDFNVTGVITGATNAGTRVNNLGYIESITTSGTPRLDYYTSSGTPGCPALLVEPSASNLVFHSSDWTSNWNAGVASGTTVVTNSAISLAPDGTATANEIYPTSGNTNHFRSSNSTTAVTYVSGTVYTQSAFFKAGVGVGIRVQLNNPSARFSQLGYANFDLINGLVSVVSGTTADTNRSARIENYGNGWYRCSFTATCTSAGTGIGVVAGLIAASGDTRSPSFSGTVTDYLLGWGAQLETGSVATSYIPTTTGSITRNAEVITVSGAVSGSIGQTEGTMYCEFEATNDAATRRVFTLSDGSQSNRIMIYYSASAWRAQVQGTSISLGNFTSGYHKIAFAYQQNGVSGNLFASIDGGAVVSGTSATFPTSLSMVTLGKIEGTTSSSFLNARIRAAALYTTRLTNDQLMLLTMPGNNTYLPRAVWDNYLSRPGNTEIPDCLYTRHADLLDV